MTETAQLLHDLTHWRTRYDHVEDVPRREIEDLLDMAGNLLYRFEEALLAASAVETLRDDLKNTYIAALAEPGGVDLVARLSSYAIAQRKV